MAKFEPTGVIEGVFSMLSKGTTREQAKRGVRLRIREAGRRAPRQPHSTLRNRDLRAARRRNRRMPVSRRAASSTSSRVPRRRRSSHGANRRRIVVAIVADVAVVVVGSFPFPSRNLPEWASALYVTDCLRLSVRPRTFPRCAPPPPSPLGHPPRRRRALLSHPERLLRRRRARRPRSGERASPPPRPVPRAAARPAPRRGVVPRAPTRLGARANFASLRAPSRRARSLARILAAQVLRARRSRALDAGFVRSFARSPPLAALARFRLHHRRRHRARRSALSRGFFSLELGGERVANLAEIGEDGAQRLGAFLVATIARSATSAPQHRLHPRVARARGDGPEGGESTGGGIRLRGRFHRRWRVLGRRRRRSAPARGARRRLRLGPTSRRGRAGSRPTPRRPSNAGGGEGGAHVRVTVLSGDVGGC